jgi:hypothetical protein
MFMFVTMSFDRVQTIFVPSGRIVWRSASEKSL